jgi:glycosyltransferase involved in cell wall biosynthesis
MPARAARSLTARDGEHAMQARRIGFVSTRLAGSDGVSLEAAKWASVLEAHGHECFYMAGELDAPAERSLLSERCHFTHPDVLDVYRGCFGCLTRRGETTLLAERIKHKLKRELHVFVTRFDLDMLLPENALSIPLNIPLGLALTEFAAETGIPMVAHHHDFFWERKRFLQNACWDYLNKAFPPHLPTIQHAVINTSQDNQLSLRTGISAVVIPNVMDFESPAPPDRDRTPALREALGMAPGEKLILQPTRVVKRKGIEHAIELVGRLGMPARLVITHASGDEGDEYSERVREYSGLLGVRTDFCDHLVCSDPATLEDRDGRFALGDFYRAADLVAYPSSIEGFGNAFLEAVYYRRPIVVNNYAIYHCDIEPKGFRVVRMDDYVSRETVAQARRVLLDPELGQEMAEQNYAIAKRFYSYRCLWQQLCTLLTNCFGM